MSVAPQPIDSSRLDRALDRLAAHCEVAGEMTRHIESRRSQVRAQLERELGPELMHKLLSGLARA